VDDEKAPDSPPAEPTPAPEPAAPAEPASQPASEPAPEPEQPYVQHPGTIPEAHEGGVIPAGPVNRTRHRQPRVFFVDTGNVSASQFAEAFATMEGLHAESGGTFPAGDIPRETLEAADEKGLDLRDARPKLIDPSRLGSFDRVVVLGGSLPAAWREGIRIEEWEVLNPSGLPLEGYRLVRDDVEKRVKRLAKILFGKQQAAEAKAKQLLRSR
jgi:arsenate reductase